MSNELQNLKIERLDQLFIDFITDICKPITQANKQPMDVILAGSDRGVQILKQKGNAQLSFPTTVVDRREDIRPSDNNFTYKSFLTGLELYKKINPEQSRIIGKDVYDVVTVKPPTYVAVDYNVHFIARTIIQSNQFQELLLNKLQKKVGTIQDTRLFFSIFYEGPLAEGNLLDFTTDEKKTIVGATFRCEGFFVLDSDIKIEQSIARNRIIIKESTFDGETIADFV